MLSDKMQSALNEQLNMELFSAYIYYSMSAYFNDLNLTGFANWMTVQAQEELTHAAKFFNFINERNGRVILKQIDGPPTQWDKPINAFEDALAHEEKVSSLINELVNLALEEKDHATNIFLQWFVTEQVEEEASVGDVVSQLKLSGDHPNGLFMIDRELARRTFVMPPAGGAQ